MAFKAHEAAAFTPCLARPAEKTLEGVIVRLCLLNWNANTDPLVSPFCPPARLAKSQGGLVILSKE